MAPEGGDVQARFGSPAPRGDTWVRGEGDALLVEDYDGRIVQVVRGVFW